jgi:hypothetical protein
MSQKTVSQSLKLKVIEELFSEFYAVLEQEGSDPDLTHYSISSVHTDLVNVALGKLKLEHVRMNIIAGKLS